MSRKHESIISDKLFYVLGIIYKGYRPEALSDVWYGPGSHGPGPRTMATRHQVGEEQAKPALILHRESTESCTARRSAPDGKASRRLWLVREDAVLKEYPIALGQNSRGAKRRADDLRTPEGRYRLDWRNPQSRFFRSIILRVRRTPGSPQSGADTCLAVAA